MNATPILPEDDPDFFPSLPTQRGGASRPGEPSLGRIDHYDLLRKLGGGGFGVVYLARDSVSGIEVALKTLHPLLKTNAEEMDALREKFRLVHGLTHPNIAKALVLHPVREVNIWDESAHREMRLSPGDSVMVMDYAPGVTLSRWRRQFPDGIVPLDLALEIARQLASALDYAHGERIVHRDIKPGNIMVETLAAPSAEADDAAMQNAQCRMQNAQCTMHNDGANSPGASPSVSSVCSVVGKQCVRVRLLDFGLAAEIRSSMSRVSTETGDTSGTRPYMAPEQWLGRKQDGRTDQYALACVLYELLSGDPPFAGVFETGDPAIMKDAVVRDTPEEIEDIPATVNAALLRALAKAPKDRFPTCAEFIAAMDETTKDTKFTKDNAGRARSPSAPSPRRRIWPWLAVAVAAAGLAPLWLGRGRPQGGPSGVEDTHAESAEFAEAVDDVPTDSAIEEIRKRAEEERQLAETARREAEAIRKRMEEEQRRLEEERKAREEADRKAEAERKGPAVAAGGKTPGERKVVSIAGMDIAFRWCPPDTFTMGSQTTEDGHGMDETQHPVTLTKGFWMGETEVTQGLWAKVMESNPSSFKSGDDYPVENVSWNDCQTFLSKLNRNAPSGWRFALPTEAQWEYACRAGSTTAYFWGNALNGDRANCDGNYPCGTNTTGPCKKKTTRVKSYQPNAWGIYDMHGNVWEWCSDWYGSYPSGAARDPVGPASGSGRIFRGGSWNYDARFCRSAFRFNFDPAYRDYYLGFRMALVPVQ